MSEIRVDEVDLSQVEGLAGVPGRLGMTFLPGKKGAGISGYHDRDLETDASTFERLGVSSFVLLVEDHELVRLQVPNIVEVMTAHGVETIRFPIEDGGAPSDPQAFKGLISEIEARLRSGSFVVVACMGGLGRTGTIVGCVLREAGMDGESAIALTRAARHGTIENRDQERFVESWE